MKIRSVAKVAVSAVSYAVYVRQRQDASTQIFSLDYGDRLRVFDAKGSLRSTRKWSSRVRCIAVADIEGEGQDALVGGVGRKVLVVDHRGKPVWNIGLEADVVACDARDIDGDDSAEVVVALENKRVILYNDNQTALFSKTMRNPIADVWLEDITNDTELEVAIADKRGNLTILTAAGYQLREIELGEKLSVFAVLTFGKRRLFVTGNHTKVLKIWDIDGKLVTTLELDDEPQAIATGIPDDVSDIAYMVVSLKDRKLSFWEVQETGRASRTEKAILQQIESTKSTVYRRAIKCGNCGAPVTPESADCPHCGAKLEMMEEYVIEEYIQESIDSITSKHSKIKLKDLDHILRRTLPRPASYNLRRSLQAMIRSGAIEGYIEGNMFVRTEKPKIKRSKKPDRAEVEDVRKVVSKILGDDNSIDLKLIERETGVDRSILRRTLLILLGDGLVEGVFQGDIFTLDSKQSSRKFINELREELMRWS